MVCNKTLRPIGQPKMVEMFYFVLLFYSVLDLNNQKILCLPSIFQFERTGTNLNHPSLLLLGPFYYIALYTGGYKIMRDTVPKVI
jgi:hypothetical protein